MPALTVNTSPTSEASRAHSPTSHSHSPTPGSRSQSQSQPSNKQQSRSSSPIRPPYSPITPVLRPAELATPERRNNNGARKPQSEQQAAPRQTYTHSQPHQTAIPQPPPQPIDFSTNPDVLALKASISILQVQARKAETDIQSLQRTKERALEDPEGFVQALTTGKLKKKPDLLFAPTGDSSDSDDDEAMTSKAPPTPIKEEHATTSASKAWPALPTPQNVIRQPPINWNKYAVVGDSLEKLHADQVARPTEGMPQRMGPDGTYVFGGEGPRRQSDMGIAAPYAPGKDKIEKMGTRKGGKR